MFSNITMLFQKSVLKLLLVKNEMECGYILSRLFLLWDSQYKLLFLSSLPIFTNHLCLKNYWKSNFFENTTTFWSMWEIASLPPQRKSNIKRPVWVFLSRFFADVTSFSSVLTFEGLSQVVPPTTCFSFSSEWFTSSFSAQCQKNTLTISSVLVVNSL